MNKYPQSAEAVVPLYLRADCLTDKVCMGSLLGPQTAHQLEYI
jgi:hypothetical protein